MLFTIKDKVFMFLQGLAVWIFLFLPGYAMAEKMVYGYIEKAILLDQNMILSAKLDTGAKSASLSAIEIRKVFKQGKLYLNFKVPDKSRQMEFSAEYIGKVRIKPRIGDMLSTPSVDFIRRPLVLMRIQIGDKIRTIPVNLTNRKRFLYPLLLGRDAINAFEGLVDPHKTFINKNPDIVCKNEIK